MPAEQIILVQVLCNRRFIDHNYVYERCGKRDVGNPGDTKRRVASTSMSSVGRFSHRGQILRRVFWRTSRGGFRVHPIVTGTRSFHDGKSD